MPPRNTINMEPDEISYRTDPDIVGKRRLCNDNTDPPENEEQYRRSKLLNNAIHNDNDDDHKNRGGRDYLHNINDEDDQTELASLSTMDTEAFRRLRAERRKENAAKNKNKSTATSSLLSTTANKSKSKAKSSPPRRRNNVRISSTEQDDTSTINSSSLASISNASNTTGTSSYYSNASNTTTSSGDTTPLRGTSSLRSKGRSSRSSRNGRGRGLPIFQTILFGMGLIMLGKMGIIELKLENSSMSFLRGSNEVKYDYTPYQEGAVPARTLDALPPDDEEEVINSETEEKIDALLNDEQQQEGIGGDDTRYSKVLPQDDTLGLAVVDNNSQEEMAVPNSIMNDNHDAIQQQMNQQQPLNSIMNDNHDAIQQQLQIGQTRPRNNWDNLGGGSQQQQVVQQPVVQQQPVDNIVPQPQGGIVEADISNGQNTQLVGWLKEQQDRVVAQGQVAATNDIQPQQIQPVMQQQQGGVISGVVGGNIDSGITGSYIATDAQPQVVAQQQVDVSPQVPQDNGVVGGVVGDNINSGVVGSDLSAMNSQQQQPLQEPTSESYFRQAVEQHNQQQQQFDAQQPFQNEQVVQQPIQNRGVVGGVVGGNINSGIVGMDLNALPIQQDQVAQSNTISEKEQKVLHLQKLLAQRQQQMAEAQAAQASQLQQQPEEQVMEFDSNFEPPVQPQEIEQPIETSNINEVQEEVGQAVSQEGGDGGQNQLPSVEEEMQSVQETNEAVVEEGISEEMQEEKEPSIGVGFGGARHKDPFDQHNDLDELRKAAMNVSNLRPPEPKRRGEDDENPSPVKEPEKVLVVEAPQEEASQEGEKEEEVESEEQSEQAVVQVQPPGGAVPYRSTIERDAQVATRKQVYIGKQAHQRGSEAFALPTGSKISLLDNDGNEVDPNAPPIEEAASTPLEEIDLTKSDPMGNDARVGTDNALDRYLSDQEKQQLQTLEAHPPEEQLTHAERLAKKHQLYNSAPGVD